MGFEVDTAAQLDFTGGRYEGAQVTARASMTFGEWIAWLQVRDSDDDAEAPADVLAYVERMYGFFADYLVEWNLTREGEPVPCDYTGFMSIDRGLQREIIQAWQRAVRSVGDPLDKPSSGGQPSAALSMPMEPMSENRAS